MPTQENHNQVVSTDRMSEQKGDVEKATAPKRRGRPPKSEEEKYKPTHIFFHPKIIKWAKAESKKTGVRYQTIINEVLLEHITV